MVFSPMTFAFKYSVLRGKCLVWRYHKMDGMDEKKYQCNSLLTVAFKVDLDRVSKLLTMCYGILPK